MDSETRFRITPQLILGACIVIVGVLFTLDNLGIANADAVFVYWPVALIAVGIAKFAQSRAGGGYFAGLMCVLVGTWLLLENLNLIDIEIWEFWPLLFVLIGGSIVWRALFQRTPRPRGDSSSTVNAVAVWAGIEQKNNAKDFRGGELTAVMGGCELDLREASIARGEAVVDAFACMGGVEIRVPQEWTVISKVFPFMGAFEDKTRPPKGEPKQTLIVRGFVFMGGIEVSN